jgi:DNA (cytosine-5)-methyltransferase 1
VCSGIEAASVAWHPLGWEPLAFSEIEAFPRAVLEHHYPGVPLHGDFTVLKDQPWIVDADVLVGGTPCQAFSVAGLRNSLDDARGNLSLEFIRLADSIDAAREAQGRDPSVIVWENVPGVLSVKDNAFGCFLAGLAGDVDPYVPPRGKWTNAGVVAGPQRTVAWRVLDAQYFGLAQRRRRVFVVASSRDGFDPAAVLLEFEGVRRDTPPRREKGQAASGGATGRAGERSHWDGDFPHPTLNQSAKSSGGVGASNQELFSQRGAYLAPAKQWPADIAPTLNAHFGEKQGLEDQHAFGGAGLFVPAGRGTPLVPVAMRESGQGYWVQDVVSDTLRTDSNRSGKEGTVIGQPHVLAAVGFDSYNLAETGDVAQTLKSPQGGVTESIGAVLAATFQQSSMKGKGTIGYDDSGVAKPVKTQMDGQMLHQHMAVRRLTPVECERLQGFPDFYTMIPWKKKPADQCPDGPRYKALGNSMAVPVMRWIGKRIAEALR